MDEFIKYDDIIWENRVELHKKETIDSDLPEELKERLIILNK